MYNSVIQHVYIALWVDHPKSNLLLSPYMSIWPPLLFTTPPLPFLVTTLLLPVSMGFCVFDSFVHLLLSFYIPHMSEIIWLLTFYVWLISLNMIFSRSIHMLANGNIVSYGWVVFYSIYVPQLLYPIIYRRAFGCSHVLSTMNMLQWKEGCTYLCK